MVEELNKDSVLTKLCNLVCGKSGCHDGPVKQFGTVKDELSV